MGQPIVHDKSYNPNCPACISMVRHTAETWLNHPERGQGYLEGVGPKRPKESDAKPIPTAAS